MSRPPGLGPGGEDAAKWLVTASFPSPPGYRGGTAGAGLWAAAARLARLLYRVNPGRAAQTRPTAATHASPPDQAATRGLVTAGPAPARSCPAEGPTL